jgi:tetratricopeptide (TPR) repeat protein
MRLLLLLALVHGSPGPDDHHRRVPRDVSAPAFDAYFGAFLSVNGLLGAIDQDGTTEGGASAAAARVMAPPEAGGKFFWLDSLLAGERKHRDGYLFDACMEYRLLAKRSGIPRSVSHAVHVRLGQATAMMFSSIEALKSYRGALSFDSESHVAYFHMGLMYARLNRIDEAVEAFRTAVFYRNNDVKSLHALGSLAFLRGREAEAKYFFKSALALDPEVRQVVRGARSCFVWPSLGRVGGGGGVMCTIFVRVHVCVRERGRRWCLRV